MTLLERADEYARKHSGLGPKDPRYQRYYRAFIAGYEAAKGDARPQLLEGHGLTVAGPRPFIIFTQINYQTDDGRFKMFSSMEELNAWGEKVARGDSMKQTGQETSLSADDHTSTPHSVVKSDPDACINCYAANGYCEDHAKQSSDDSFRCLGCRGVIATPKVCLDCYEAGVRETDSSKENSK